MKEIAKLVECTEFEVGDVICHKNNFLPELGLMIFFKATDYDVKNYSGKKQVYIKLIKS